ncbi:MAG: zf-HC2 domain-containing protein [Acidobacteria bacterium]|nr:zf-HC2 domain-containing protein [Acidobacteriota bacterium]
MKRCLDEGLLQSYLDGELSPEMTREAAAHVALCGACAEALASAENESAFFAEAFALDDSISVPTERLRSRVNAAVAQLEASESENGKRAGWNLQTLAASLSDRVAARTKHHAGDRFRQ